MASRIVALWCICAAGGIATSRTGGAGSDSDAAGAGASGLVGVAVFWSAADGTAGEDDGGTTVWSGSDASTDSDGAG